MSGFPSPFGGDRESSDPFDEYDEFVPEHLPTPGGFLQNHSIVTGQDHIEFHQTTRELFEDRGVYDMTFGYNLARLNLDTCHPNAGYRYAVESDDSSVLRAEFTPTTPFCPQSDTLTKGSFRAWNGLRDRHEYDIVRVRVAKMHHRSDQINDALADLEEQFRETGSVSNVPKSTSNDGAVGKPSGCSDDTDTTSRGYGPDAPF